MFPYADGEHDYWTGYYSSRARSKGFIRDLSRYSHIADSIDTLRILEGEDEQILSRF